VLNAAQEVDAQFVLISSDKAACPRSVMGATKRFAELAVLAPRGSRHRPVVVRFGNVLASSGSFVEVMRERIRAGRSIQVTDPEATRFFMSLSESASLVMKASTLARGGETFWLDMGEPIRIGDLADRLLRSAVGQGWPVVPVEIVGLRPGEKLSEQLTSQGISMKRTEHPSIWVARQPKPAAAIAMRLLPAVRRAVHSDDALAALELLTAAVPDFVPSAQAWAVARSEPTITAARQPAATTAPVVHSAVLPRRARTAVTKIVAIRRHADVTPSGSVARGSERGALAADGPVTAGGRL
jgi:FlaA1/EpsC-like NDP-sugar epimerase